MRRSGRLTAQVGITAGSLPFCRRRACFRDRNDYAKAHGQRQNPDSENDAT